MSKYTWHTHMSHKIMSMFSSGATHHLILTLLNNSCHHVPHGQVIYFIYCHMVHKIKYYTTLIGLDISVREHKRINYMFWTLILALIAMIRWYLWQQLYCFSIYVQTPMCLNFANRCFIFVLLMGYKYLNSEFMIIIVLAH